MSADLVVYRLTRCTGIECFAPVLDNITPLRNRESESKCFLIVDFNRGLFIIYKFNMCVFVYVHAYIYLFESLFKLKL